MPDTTPPEGYVLYTGPKDWRNLPPWSMYYVPDMDGWRHAETVTACPGDHLYAIPANSSDLKLPPQTPKTDILEEARQIIQGDRAADYGEAKASFNRIAQLWSVYKGVEITAKDVASMMILLKMSRSVTSNKRDNWLDTIGYAALGSELE